jgi:hypothetical protein
MSRLSLIALFAVRGAVIGAARPFRRPSARHNQAIKRSEILRIDPDQFRTIRHL